MIPERIFFIILNMSLTGSLMILAVLLMRLFLRRAPKIFSYMLWLIVLFRLLCPVSFESDISLLNVLGVSSVGNGTVDFISESLGTEGSSRVEGLFGNLNMSLESAGTDDEIRAALQEGNTSGNNRYGYAGQGGTTLEDGRRQDIQSETTNPNIIQQETEPGETMQDESVNNESVQPDTAGQAAAYEDTDRQGNIQQETERESSDKDNTEALILGSLHSSQIQSVFSVGSIVWLIGVAILLLYGFVSYVHLNRKLYRLEAKALEPEDISALKNRTRIYRCDDIPTAFVLGLFRPRIYLPANLDETEERYILLHEQVHIKRGDSLYRTVAYLALCLHWFNPLAWLAFHLSGMDMEMSCDEAVIRQIGSGIKKEYSQTLLALATGSSMVKGIPLAFGEGDTGSRIKNVLGYKKPTVILIAAALVLCLGGAVFLLGNPLNNITEDNGEIQVLEDDAADETDLSEGESNDNSAGNSNNLTNEQQGTGEYSNSVVCSEHSILDMENDQRVIFQTNDNSWIIDVLALEDTVYAILGDDISSYPRRYHVVAIDREKSIDAETQEEYYPVTEVGELESENDSSFLGMGYYNNTLYIQDYNRNFPDSSYHYYAYIRQEDGGYLKTQDDFCLLLAELYEQYNPYGRDFSEDMAYLDEKDQLFFQVDSVIYLFDTEGNLIREYAVDEEGYPGLKVLMPGEQFLLKFNGAYYVYDTKDENGSLIPVNSEDSLHNIIKVSDDYIYYYKEESPGYRGYRIKLDTGEEELLFEIEMVPGQPGFLYNHIGCAVWNDCIYFRNFDEEALWWFSCDLSDEEHTITRLDIADDYKGRFYMVSVDSADGTYYCSECGEWVYDYYIEDVQISDTSIPHWEEINEILRETTDGWIENSNDQGRNVYGNGTAVTDPNLIETGEESAEDHLRHNDYLSTYYFMCFYGITRCTLESVDGSERYDCLELDYYRHWRSYQINISRTAYTGLWFDLSDGSGMNLGDICSISEEDFRTLAAEYTVPVCQNAPRYQAYFKDREEEEIYAAAYEYAGFDCVMELTSEGVMIIYNTDSLGVEKIDIRVTIPYEELGLRLVAIYGENE